MKAYLPPRHLWSDLYAQPVVVDDQLSKGEIYKTIDPKTIRMSTLTLVGFEVRQIVRDGLADVLAWIEGKPAAPEIRRQPHPLPSSVTIGRVREAIAMLFGVDALDNMRAFTLHRGGVEVELYAKDDRGRRFAVDDEIAIDRVHVKVEW